MSNLDTSSFDMSALMDACRDISANQEVEDKVKKTNLFHREETGSEKVSRKTAFYFRFNLPPARMILISSSVR